MSGEYEQIPESFIKELEAKRKRLVEAQEENGVNLDALVDFLYPDTAHLVFELLQNAEDAGALSVCFELGKNKLSFIHDGRPFSKEDLDSITNYFRSAKYEKEDTIGRFGIGFKSVFVCTETPRIYSDTVAFEIVDRIVPKAIPQPTSSILLSDRQTVFDLPFNSTIKTSDDVREEIRLGLARMSVMSVLHLESIKTIEWRTEDGDSGWIKRVELDDGVVQVDSKRPSGEERCWFLRFREPYAEGTSMHLDVVFELQEKELEQETLSKFGEALADRYRIVPSENGSVAVFFPAEKETSNLRFHLHAPFIPELSRASIKEHPHNTALIGRLAELVAESLSTIRDMDFLDREFLGVLPNSKDPLPEAYKPFHEAVVQAMREEPLVPMQGGGYERATRLLQGPANFKECLSVKDVRFLISGWDYEKNTLQRAVLWSVLSQGDWGGDSSLRKIDRSTELSSNCQGWAVAATQSNTAVDRLLDDLTIRKFEIGWVVPPDSKTHAEITKWIATHDASWHRAYYALVDRHWDASHDTYERLRALPIVRTQADQYRLAAECYFAHDGDDAPEGITVVDPDTYSSGTRAKAAKAGLERLGIKEIDEVTRAVGILNAYYVGYGGQSSRLPWDRHRVHIENFIRLAKQEQITVVKFHEYSLLLDSDKEWKRPRDLYVGNEYVNASAAPYYQSLKRHVDRTEIPNEQVLRYEIDARYRNISGFSEFAKCIGVTYSIPISKTVCRRNPDWNYLQSGGGAYPTHYRTDRDWHIPNLDAMLQRLEQAGQSEAEREDLARAIHAALDETREHTWPPPEHVVSEQDVSGLLVAVYRMNASASFRTTPSQLVFALRKYAWVPQVQDRNGLVFVKPREARSDRLPEGFAFDSGWAWIRATEFGAEHREVDVKIVEERPALAEADQEASARVVGFPNLKAAEEGRRFAALPEEQKKEFWERLESKERRIRDFDSSPNPERRRAMAKREAEIAPDRVTELRDRSVLIESGRLREEARSMLQAYYEPHAHQSLCQVSDCKDRSFKRENGTWYFEAVRFLGLRKMHASDHLALCPRHAAMFQHVNESKEGLKREFTMRCASGKNGTLTIPVVLAGKDVEVFLHPNHAIDLEAALKVESSGERDTEDDRPLEVC
ncbi:MAG: ATP-binding protein [Caldilineaceae bacterium SB0662_bin_9]|uniref:ATP-binding protein n=1 Tax=Caldilineaceae bacterium SB0662_bin_9 TaxID=2605258 RepID=A0A6B1DZ20_9CHLR|nr:ATP-binding protein [Caldilineaceae bacterium SB0662_bin_9]